MFSLKIISLLAIAELCYVSFYDWKFRKIPNYFSVFNVALYAICSFLISSHYAFGFSVLLYPVVIFCLGLCLYALKIMGAGDVKFLSSFLFLIPREFHLLFLENLAWVSMFAGGLLLFCHIMKKRELVSAMFWSRSLLFIKDLTGSRFPYAPVISCAYLWTIIASDIF